MPISLAHVTHSITVREQRGRRLYEVQRNPTCTRFRKIRPVGSGNAFVPAAVDANAVKNPAMLVGGLSNRLQISSQYVPY